MVLSVQEDLSKHAIDSEEQQAAVLAIADEDGFNWGYDPVHYMAPEGSYASNPDGSARVVDFRQMVQSLHGLGLKVVLDVVYNHTFAAGELSDNPMQLVTGQLLNAPLGRSTSHS